MGFIDYKGTKEDRYEEVLEYAKSQQEEESRRLEELRVRQWMAAILGNTDYAGSSPEDLVRYMFVSYRKLEKGREAIFAGKEIGEGISLDVLWKDLCTALVFERLAAFSLPEERRFLYYRTFMEKIFRLRGFTEGKAHEEYMRQKPSYQKYFSACFDLTQEKQFWKLAGRLAGNAKAAPDRSSAPKEKAVLGEFAACYEQLSILMGYYLYTVLSPGNAGWRQRLAAEHQALEKLRAGYQSGQYKEPTLWKLKNPLYVSDKAGYEPAAADRELADGTEKRDRREAADTELFAGAEKRQRRPKLDRTAFAELLEKKELTGYIQACSLLRQCRLPEPLDALYQELLLRLPVLQETLDKFQEIYQPDMYSFYEYYLPEALQMTATYLEYLDVGIGEKILRETEQEVQEALRQLLTAVNDTIDEVYRFASMEVKARAKALASMMEQDGYVAPEFRIQTHRE